MKLRPGQDVHTSDGAFGALGDIIVDPVAKSVTHIVVKPLHKHQHARLVPIWLVRETQGILHIDLDAAHLRRLERVSFSDYLKLSDAIDVGDAWDIGTHHVLSLPYHDIDVDMTWSDESIAISYDPIPKGECEIRRASRVFTSDNETIGSVHGFAADNHHIKAVIIRAGLPGFRHDVLVPIGSVKAVRIDEVELALTKDEFSLLPETDALGESDDGLKAHVLDFRRQAESLGGTVIDRGRSLATSARDRIRSA